MKVDLWFIFPRMWQRHRHHHHPDRELFVWFGMNETLILLKPREKEFLMRQLHIDQIDNLSISATDKDGNIVSPIAFDAAPVWTNTNEGAARLTPSATGTTALLEPLTIDGVTTIGVQVSIGGVVFNASADYTVISGAVAAIDIVDTFAPKPTA